MSYNPLDPMVGVVLDRRLPGLGDLAMASADYPPLTVLPLSEALAKRWNSDACLVTYLPYVEGSPQDICPRLNKKGPVLHQLRDKGVEILCSMLVLDYDNPGHRPWSQALVDGFQEALCSVAESGFDLASKFNWAYMTLHGARLIYVLDEPVPPERYEALARGLVAAFTEAGIRVDPLVNWNCLFACPQQTKESRNPKQSWTGKFYELFQNRVKPHTDKDLPTTAEEDFQRYASAELQIPDGVPDYDDSQDLVRDRASAKLTPWGKEAKRRLRGRDCYDCLFEGQDLASHGKRNDTLHSFVGSAIKRLIGLVTDEGEETTPEHIFGLFYEPVSQLEPDSGDPDWYATLWSAIRRWWAVEHANMEALRAEVLAKEADASTQQMVLLSAAREWCEDPALYEREDKAWSWLSRRLIVCLGKSFYVMGQNGYYTGPCNKDMLHSQIRENGIDAAIELYKTTEKGGVIARSPQDLLNEHAITVQGSVGRAGGAGHYLEGTNTPNPRLVMSLYRRRKDLDAEYHPEVDRWLKLLFGDQWEIGVKWLAWALAFEDGPICALSLEGKAGSGKKMLVQGLAECLELPEVATSNDIVGKHQEGLLRSPFVVVDEGFPNKGAHMHPADMFRHLVSGDPTQINPKFKSPVRVYAPCRVIFTANNLGVVQQLGGGKTLSPDDREAIAKRLLHVNIAPDAAEWLAKKGGLDYTSAKGGRWISKDSYGGSDFLVAKHILWLYEQRHHIGRHGRRFLVEGPLDSLVMFQLRTQSGMTPVVTETLLSMLNASQRDWTKRGFLVRPRTEERRGQVWVLTSEIKRFYEQNWKPGSEKLTSAMINEVLRGLVDKPVSEAELPERPALKIKRWHSIDLHLLNMVARQYGWVCPTLDKIMHGGEVSSFDDLKERAEDRGLEEKSPRLA